MTHGMSDPIGTPDGPDDPPGLNWMALEKLQWSEEDEDRMLEFILFNIFGEDVWDDSAIDTAQRVLRYWKSMTPSDEMRFKFTTFPADVNQMIVVNNIEFASMCAHHLLPFYGEAHVGYIPNELMVGLSKIPRVVDHFARRPQTQERMTADIAKFLKHELKCHGVAVIVEARHTCMACRGVRKHNGSMTTSELRGVFLTGHAAKTEFLQLVGLSGNI